MNPSFCLWCLRAYLFTTNDGSERVVNVSTIKIYLQYDIFTQALDTVKE